MIAVIQFAPSDALVVLVPWLLAAILCATLSVAVGCWMLFARVKEFEHVATRLTMLEEINAALSRLARDREDLDVRRLEHLLIEIRDGQRRMEEHLLRAAQSGARTSDSPGAPSTDARGLSERIVQRLLARGFEQVQVVPTLDELARLFAADGLNEVLIEARRNGVLCKGRALVQGGAVVDVEMQPAYSMFP
jgi:hypothetical protein